MKLQKYITERKEFGLTEKENQELRQILDILEDDCKYFIREWQKTNLGFLYRGYGFSPRIINSIKPRRDRYSKDIPEILHEHFDEIFKAKFGWGARSEGVFCTSKESMAKSYGHSSFFFPAGKYQYLWSPNIDDLYAKVEGGLDDYTDYDLSSYDYEDYEDDWGDEYGVNKDGSWSYKGDEYDSVDDIVEEIIEDDDDLSEDDWDDVENEVEKEAEWLPGMSLEDYAFDLLETRKREIEDQIFKIVNSYKNKDLRGAIKSENEMMFRCKKYYLVNTKFEDGLSELLGVPPKGAMKQLKMFPSRRSKR